MPLSTTPTVVKRYIGFELQRLREAAGKSQPEAGKEIDTSKAKISHFESGRNLPSLLEAEALLNFYGAPDLIDLFKDLIVQAREAKSSFDLDPSLDLAPGFSMYVGLEQGASRIFTYDAVVVKGILQCRRYAEATIRGYLGGEDLSDDQVHELVDLRMRRQNVLHRTEPRLDVVAVINQGVLYHQVGGPVVAAEQLAHLLSTAERDNVTIRVLPYDIGAHPALHGPFTRLEFPIPRDPGVVYLEDLVGGRYRDDTEDIDRYADVGDRLLELALPERESLSLIDTIRRELAP
ncbi:DNA-binding XRE family transcriptional regulator [Saccharothrix ecbatanensis]|uniref:DNA-binding XRE family transcriptional regulator n=1 Tax=Saccharothrix ecbatanensis TaxID=1105145 RepID=A0A7W9HIS2_9PSEU|nr:helix-turn-helix transcriptional regulator [Saccharothrix ecbatanensis]MBB5802895.1 DNA-binding XRE family transcriptional regulator [Saccharothrix ecbatanensis]